MGREQRDTGVREEALGRRHVIEGGGGVGAERQDERRSGRRGCICIFGLQRLIAALLLQLSPFAYIFAIHQCLAWLDCGRSPKKHSG